MIDQPIPAELPQHLCHDCLVTNQYLRIPLDGGGDMLGTYCDHHQCGCAIKVDDTGKPSPWLTIGPVNVTDFRKWLTQFAGNIMDS